MWRHCHDEGVGVAWITRRRRHRWSTRGVLTYTTVTVGADQDGDVDGKIPGKQFSPVRWRLHDRPFSWPLYLAPEIRREANDNAKKKYSGTPFERPPWWEATPSGKATWQCKSKHKCIDFYPWREATPLERPLFWCKRGGLTRGVPLYYLIICEIIAPSAQSDREFPQFHSNTQKISVSVVSTIGGRNWGKQITTNSF